MKSIVNTVKNRKLNFPKIMISTDTGTVILATSSNIKGITGIVLKDPSGNTAIGKQCDMWSHSSFVELNGSITLENSED